MRALLLLLLVLMSVPIGGASYVPVTLTLLPPSGPFGFRPMTPAWKEMAASVNGDVLTLSFGKERLTYRIVEHVTRPDGATYLHLTDGRGVLLRRR